MMGQDTTRAVRPVAPPPRNWRQRLKWLGPGITWMAAGAGGAGELLFPPRVGSLYGYTFLWALLLAVALKWFINREIGRFSVCSGGSLLDGYRQLPGPRNWAVWLIVLPQLVVAVASIAGIAGAAATALILLLPGPTWLWTAVTLATASGFLLVGQYKVVEKASMVLAILLGLAGIVTAITVFPAPAKLLSGMVPRLPGSVDYAEIIPWLSFILAGAAGMTWYSYWVPAKGYGAAGRQQVQALYQDPQEVTKLKGWLREMTLDNTLGVLGGLLIVTSFLILGTELLRPQGLVPEENQVAAVLGKLLEESWGRAGFWFMVVGVLIGFWNTTMTNQDGWARLLSNGTGILLQPLRVHGRWGREDFLRKVYLVALLSVAPCVLYAVMGEPVGLLQLAGTIEAVHIPIITGLTLYMNRKFLPPALRPSVTVVVINTLAAVFFLGFATLFLLQLTGAITL